MLRRHKIVSEPERITAEARLLGAKQASRRALERTKRMRRQSRVS